MPGTTVLYGTVFEAVPFLKNYGTLRMTDKTLPGNFAFQIMEKFLFFYENLSTSKKMFEKWNLLYIMLLYV